MRVTKTIAENIAKTVVNEKFNDKIHAIKTKMSDIILNEHNAYYPNDLILLFNANNKYFFQKTTLYFTKAICVDNRLRTEKSILSDFEQDKLSDKAIKDLSKLNRDLMDIFQSKKELECEIITALSVCKTYKNVSENLPKLAKYLPKIEKTEVQINYKSINEKI